MKANWITKDKNGAYHATHDKYGEQEMRELAAQFGHVVVQVIEESRELETEDA